MFLREQDLLYKKGRSRGIISPGSGAVLRSLIE
jgi:hypothetical protein